MAASPSDIAAVDDADADDVAESWNLLCRTTRDTITTTRHPLEALERIHRVVYDMEGDPLFHLAIHQTRESGQPRWRVTLAHENLYELTTSVLERYGPAMGVRPYSNTLEEAIESLFGILVRIVEKSLADSVEDIRAQEEGLLNCRERAHVLRRLRKYMGTYDRYQEALPF